MIKYNISNEDADTITTSIKTFMNSLFEQEKSKEKIEEDFPVEATIYRDINEKPKIKIHK